MPLSLKGKAKTKLVNGIRVNIQTGLPVQQSTIGQQQKLKVSGLGTPQLPQSISSYNLQGSTPFSLPSIPTPTAASGLLGQFEALVAQNKQQADQNFQLKQSQAQQSQANLQGAISSYLGKGEEQLQLEEGADIAGKTQKVTDYTNQLEAEQQALRKQIEKIEKNEQGLLSGAVASEVSRVERESISKQADLAILQNAANRDLATAQSIIDRKIELKYEPLRERIDFLREFNNQNQDILTRAEQNQLQQRTNEENRVYEQLILQDKRAYEAYSQAAENGAPDAVQKQILDAINRGDYQGAQQLAGQYAQSPEAGVDLQIKQAQLKKLNAETSALGIPKITNLEVAQYADALNVILGSGQFTKDQKASITNAINNGQDPFTVVKNQAKNIMGQTLATNLDKYETASSQLESINTLLSDYYSAGGKTGLLTGNYEKVINKLGQVKDPALVDISTNIAAALQIYRNAVSGTAYSVQEGKDIASIFPGINKSQGLNQAILSGRRKAFETTIDAGYRNTLGSVYDKLKGAQSQNQSVSAQNSLDQLFQNLDLSQLEALFNSLP